MFGKYREITFSEFIMLVRQSWLKSNLSDNIQAPLYFVDQLFGRIIANWSVWPIGGKFLGKPHDLSFGKYEKKGENLRQINNNKAISSLDRLLAIDVHTSMPMAMMMVAATPGLN